jgi:membrane-associated phospholipid phosphatase
MLTGVLCCRLEALASDSTQTIPAVFVSDVNIALEDAGSFFTAPFRFSGTEWIYAGAVAGGTPLLMSLDESVRRKVSRHVTSSINGDFWDIPTRYGVVTYANVLSVAAYATGLFVGSDELRVTGRLMFESLSLAGVSVITIRYIAARSRPYSGDGPWKFHGFTWNNEIQSFPSGHTTVAFALSTVIAERFDNVWARVGFYGMATLTAFARVHNNQHWMSDVVIGAGLGIAAGFHVVAREEERSSAVLRDQSRLHLLPSPGGLTLVLFLR